MAQDTSSTKTTKALDDYVLLGRSGLRVSPLCLGTLVRSLLNLPTYDVINYNILITLYIIDVHTKTFGEQWVS
jgi:hypothetical protein